MYRNLFERPLIFENVYDGGTSLWFTEYEYNALMKMDKKSHRIEWKGSFPGESFWEEHLYTATAECDGKLYFAPYWAKEIGEYDLKTETIKKIPLLLPPKKYGADYENGRFIRAARVGKKVYFIPACYPGILCYDTEQKRMDCVDDWVDKIEEIRVSPNWYFAEFELVDNKLILPCACADAMVVLDVIEGKSKVIQTPPTHASCKFGGICRIGDYLYLASEDGTVSKRNVDSIEKEIKRWKVPISGLNEVEWYPVRYAGSSVYLFPNGDQCAYRIDHRIDEEEFIPILKGKKEWPGYNFLYLSALWDGSRFYLSKGIDQCLLEYDPEGERTWEYQLFLPESEQELLREYKEKELRNRLGKKVIAENEADTLTDLLNILEAPDCPRKGTIKGRLENGRNIYQALCK